MKNCALTNLGSSIRVPAFEADVGRRDGESRAC